MASLAITARGVDDLVVALGREADVLRAGLPEAREEHADLIATEARTKTAPVRTGYLAEHTVARGAEVVSSAPYAVFVDARTRFLSRAVALAEQAAETVYQRHLDDLVERIERTTR